MWNAESMVTKLPQSPNLKELVFNGQDFHLREMALYYDCKQSRLRFNKETLYVKGKTDTFQLNDESISFCILYQLYHFIKNVNKEL